MLVYHVIVFCTCRVSLTGIIMPGIRVQVQGLPARALSQTRDSDFAVRAPGPGPGGGVAPAPGLASGGLKSVAVKRLDSD